MSFDFQKKRVTVMGLGRFGGGVGVTRWLVAQGARVLVTDRDEPDKLTESIAAVRPLGVALRLGTHERSDFVDTDLVIVNPAVPPNSEFVQAARDAGVPITTEINLFVERCRGITVGVTGSVGKSTTTAMIGHVLERTLRDRKTWIGGNLGLSLLDSLDAIRERDIVVLELSSFQLERTPAVGWSPHVAVLTNLSANHIDWHGTFAAYTAAKLNLVRFQRPERDHIIIGEHGGWREHFDQLFGDVAGIWRYAAHENQPVAVRQSTPAVDCDDEQLAWPTARIGVPGRHNVENAAAALCVAHALGAAPDEAAAALADFHGLPHRLQRVALRDGVAYYNDSKSTTPESAITAMNAFDGPLLLILGGYDKGSDLTPVAELAARKARFAACIGITGPTMSRMVTAAGGKADVFDTFEAAFAACRTQAIAGDTVLLSPACASWGMFTDYRERGELFAQLAMQS